MAASDVATLISTIIQVASAVQDAGNNWYRASADWREFPGKVQNLQRQHDFWQAKLTQYGMLSDTSLVESLSEAKAILDEEHAGLSRRQARCGAGFWSKVCMTMFPAKIGLSIQQAIDKFDAILSQLEKEHAVDLVLDKRLMARSPTFTVRSDERYVSLVQTQSALYSALDNPEGNSIVLLYGSSGKGKSTLARHAVLRYQQTRNSTLFERVVFLECGPEAEPSAKQFDLLQLLGPTTSASEEQNERKTTHDEAIRKRISSLLKDQKILIILDDIWKEDFLKRMVELCGARVKCLVTSQRGDLCNRFSFSVRKIQIEDANEEVAMKILASHVGFKDKKIPEQIKGVAKQLVQKTEGHPLALASIATAIDENRSDELEEWEAASHNFLDLLYSEDTAYIHGEKYPRSFWSAMQLSVNSLKKDSKNLLILVHMCAGPSIPEEVLRVLYNSVKFQGTSEPFEKMRKDLESRELIKIASLENDRSWSVHSLQKLFIEKEMRDLKESMFILLAPETSECIVKSKIITEFSRAEDAMVQITLCALYFDEDFSDRVLSKMDIPSESLSGLRRNVIEPITHLLGRPLSEHWNSDAQSFAKQIFLKYIHNNVLHSEGVLQLLKLQISILPMLSALESVATIDTHKASLLDLNSRGLIQALVDLLEDEDTSNASIAMAAARAVWGLGANKFHSEIIISTGILKAIVRVLSSESSTDLQVILLRTLGTLGLATTNIPVADIIVETPGILPLLVKLLFNADNVALQGSAIAALGNLTSTKLAAHRIIQVPGIIEQLINLLSEVSRPFVQAEAAMALGELCRGPEETILMVINSTQALEQLVTLLSFENSPTFWRGTSTACSTVKILSRGLCFMEPASIKQKFKETHGLMNSLQGLIAYGIPEYTQREAIGALTYLDPAQGNGACLHSADAYFQRGYANFVLGLNKEALNDCNEAYRINPEDLLTLMYVRMMLELTCRASTNIKPSLLRSFEELGQCKSNLLAIKDSLPWIVHDLSWMRSNVRARLADFQGALADANTAIEIDQKGFYFQERGVLKRMMGDLPGALADLNQALDLDFTSGDYECLKHRGYVRFLMKDEEGAASDAEMALKVQYGSVDNPAYGHNWLGTTSVEFLDYKVR